MINRFYPGFEKEFSVKSDFDCSVFDATPEQQKTIADEIKKLINQEKFKQNVEFFWKLNKMNDTSENISKYKFYERSIIHNG